MKKTTLIIILSCIFASLAFAGAINVTHIQNAKIDSGTASLTTLTVSGTANIAGFTSAGANFSNATITGSTIDSSTIGSITTLNTLYVDGNRGDTYTADGGLSRPYKTVAAALTAVNADSGKSWVVNIAPGDYTANLTITGPRHLRFQAPAGGVTLSGTILINSGVGSYDRIEFVGVNGHRAEKGPAMTISGKITATRTNDSLIYVNFDGCYITGAFEATTAGTWVLQYRNCRVNGAITGTFAVNTQLDSSILIETYGFNEFTGAITGIVSFYNCNGSDIYSNLTITPWFENRFTHTSFAGSVSIIPQAGAASNAIYVDDISYKNLVARTPTITGAAYSQLGFNPAVPGAIGGTTPAAGTFTNIAGGNLTVSSVAANAIMKSQGAANVIASSITDNGTNVTVGEMIFANLTGNVTGNASNADHATNSDTVYVPKITAGSGTGISVTNTGSLNMTVYTVSANYVAFTDTDTTKGLVIATLPAKTKIKAIYADTTAAYTGANISAANLAVGITAEGGNTLILEHGVLSGTVTKGLANADMGSAMSAAALIQGGYLPSWSGTTAIYATLLTVGENTDKLATGATTFYIITERY